MPNYNPTITINSNGISNNYREATEDVIKSYISGINSGAVQGVTDYPSIINIETGKENIVDAFSDALIVKNAR